MKLHPLTKELISVRSEYSPHRDQTIDKIVRGYLTGRSEWLKTQYPEDLCESTSKVFRENISLAFQLAPATLEEKFKAIRLKHDGNHPSPEAFWDSVLKEFAETAEEHFNNQPSEKVGIDGL